MQLKGVPKDLWHDALFDDFRLGDLPVNGGASEVRYYNLSRPDPGHVYVVRVDSMDVANRPKVSFLDPATGQVIANASDIAVDLTDPAVWRNLPSTIDRAVVGHNALLCATAGWISQVANAATGKYIGKYPKGSDDDARELLLRFLLDPDLRDRLLRALDGEALLSRILSKPEARVKALGLLDADLRAKFDRLGL